MLTALSDAFSPLLVILYSSIILLFIIAPGRIVKGYINDPATGQKYLYRLNGLLVFWIVVLTSVALVYTTQIEGDVLFVNRWAMLFTANLIGLAASTFFYVRGDTKAAFKPTQQRVSQFHDRSPLVRGVLDFYSGLEDDPHFKDLDAKMFLYLIGGTVLVLNVLSSAYWQYLQLGGSLPTSTAWYCLLFSYFVVEYLWHEEIHLYTFDFVAEKLGAKLIWGCTVFYPFVYPIGVWSIAYNPHFEGPLATTIIGPIAFVTGYVLARGANNQKYHFKVNPTAKFMNLIEQRSLGGKVLISGFWGLSRHINYLGEVLMSVGLALLLDFTSPLAWVHPIFYASLFVARQIQDDYVCSKKYGSLWQEYCKLVPYRIIPYVY